MGRYKRVWITTIFLFVTTLYMTLEAFFYWTPNIYVIFVIVFLQGYAQGSGYVNTFYRITEEVPVEQRMFAMAITDFSDTPALSLAGFLGMN